MYPVESERAPGFVKSQGTWMGGILVVQMVLVGARLFILNDVVSGFFMGLSVAFGWYVLKKNMDITLASAWGLFNAWMCLIDTVHSLSAVITHVISLNLLKVALVLAMPMADFLGASYAWELFKDHERAGGMLKPLFASKEIPVFAHYHGDEEQQGYAQAQIDEQYMAAERKFGAAKNYGGYYPQEQEMQNPMEATQRRQNLACC
eukprot:TRINITY_DN20851_c0_g1_i1.p1 TRINITY_DN20851_c0_g1~~TRINITY_DN20851_c0_g1_i1.p1  ORF type:complete len:205 (+),score=51.36 TRINITY_DN20851_c0_g1_i1:172-786(+)